jgi:drug/metabolite transporter (DMT)-like permease
MSVQQSEAGRRPGPTLILLLIGLLCLIWGSTWIVIKQGLADLPPFSSVGIRFILAGTIMAALAPMLAGREGGKRPTLGINLVHGLGGIAACYGLVYWAETVLPSGLVSLLWGVFPMMLAAISTVYLKDEQVTARQWAGFSLGFVGVVILFFTDLRELGPGAVPAGLLLLLSPAACAVSTVYVKRHGEATSSILMNRNGMWIGGVALLFVALFTERDAEFEWTQAAVISLTYLTLVGTVVAFGVYFWLLRYAPAHLLGLIAYVTPIIALTLGATIDDEPVGWHTLLGGALVFSGVGLVVRRRATARAPEH